MKLNDRARTLIVTAVLLIAVPCVLCAGLVFGSEKLPLQDVLHSLFSFRQDPQEGINFTYIIVHDLRLPRTLLALLCGALLAGSGAVFQGFFKSPLADSSILGVSSGAALGAVLGSILKAWIPGSAFIGAILSILVVYAISGGRRSAAEPIRLLLAGSAVGTFLTAINSSLLLIHDKELYKMYVWTLGSFNGKGWTELRFILVPAIISFILLLLCMKPLDILSSGDMSSQSLGISLSLIRPLCFLTGALSASAAVSAGGIIGFVGLVAPHIIRMTTGSSYKKIIPLSMLMGAAFLGFSDILARTVAAPLDIPIGILTAIEGAPFFIFLLLRHNRRYSL